MSTSVSHCLDGETIRSQASCSTFRFATTPSFSTGTGSLEEAMGDGSFSARVCISVSMAMLWKESWDACLFCDHLQDFSGPTGSIDIDPFQWVPSHVVFCNT